jgi:hypothetical protein
MIKLTPEPVTLCACCGAKPGDAPHVCDNDCDPDCPRRCPSHQWYTQMQVGGHPHREGTEAWQSGPYVVQVGPYRRTVPQVRDGITIGDLDVMLASAETAYSEALRRVNAIREIAAWYRRRMEDNP